MTRLLQTTACALLAGVIGVTATAAPLCPQFLSPDAMPSKYRRLAPVFSGAPSDWIIARDQLKGGYVPGVEAMSLIAQVVEEFEARGTRLAILMAPPRPVVAGKEALMRVSAGTAEYDTDAMAAAFSEMVTAVQGTGAIMPDLARLALSDADVREAFYFRHDTHWTPMGAARSAEVLADLVAERLPGVFPKAGHAHAAVAEGGPEIAEEGSLAVMANKVCGAKVPPVTVPVPVFPDTGGSLLGDVPELPRVALAGSSFSDRYKRDHYRVADALAGALGAEVANYSVSGGGAIGALESLVLSGELERQRFDLVVWEIPYTQGFRSVGMLRQLLGALRYEAGGGLADRRPLDASGKTKISVLAARPDLLVLNLPDSTAERVSVDIRDASGKKRTLKLVRKRRIQSDMRSDTWVVSLRDLPAGAVDSLTVRYNPDEVSPAASLTMRF